MSTSDKTEAAFTSLSGPASLAEGASSVLSNLAENTFASRLSEKDHTLWHSDPTELTDRLGWVDVVGWMRPKLPEIRKWSEGLKSDGVKDVVLLGMGGSSLAPEVFFRTFGPAEGSPRLHVLDSTSPAWIRRVTQEVDPAHTHFLVASKSGTTIEVLTLFEHFWRQCEDAGISRPGQHFSSITDPGTPLESMAKEKGFRANFSNPADIGGRYSALSFFGIVPAAALGIDVEGLFASADTIREACRNEGGQNPGCVLGALMGAANQVGRDKLTLITSPALSSFGLWVEQLLAESTGKSGRGIVPVTGEPWVGAEAYGDDRVFVAVRLEGDENQAFEGRVKALTEAGHPVWTIDMKNREAMGGEMFRWEYATAVAGHVLQIHPFNQPDVQSAKSRAQEILERLASGEALPQAQTDDAAELLSKLQPGDYVALMVYGEPDEEVNRALDGLRARIQAKKCATTLGIGPRFLHSTGQLHKGGDKNIVAIQLVLDEEPLTIPGRPFGFGQLMGAQATGDLLALQGAGKRVARVDVSGGAVAALGRLGEALS